MPLERYERPPASGRLIQGEVIGPVWEYVPAVPPTEVARGAEIPVSPIRHERLILVTQDCDLEQDYALRFPRGWDDEPVLVDDEPGAVPHVVLCESFEELRSRVAGGDIFRRAKRNQDERYHTLPDADVTGTDLRLPTLYIDFRRAVALPTRFVYAGLREGGIERLALLPEIFRLDLAHRFFGYLSRVPVP